MKSRSALLLFAELLLAMHGPVATAADLKQAADALAARHPGESGLLVLDRGVEALRQRDVLVAAATRSIDAQYYIWNADASGRYMAARLLAAAERGVRVRVLLDDINIVGRDAVLAGLAAHPGVEVRIYNPAAAGRGVLRLIGFVLDFSRVNRRMHNKSFTVDGAVTIVGGRNVGDEYFDLHPDRNFRDRELLVAGPVVAEVDAAFDAFWNSPWTRPVETLARPVPPVDQRELLAAASREVAALGYGIPADADAREGVQAETLPALLWAPVRLVFDPPPTADQIAASGEQQPVARELRRLVATARKEILVESAYFILAGESLDEAARLHEAGVRLRVLTNSLASNDLVTNHSGYARRRPAMLAAGIELHELRPDAAACRRLVTVSRACEKGPGFSLHSKSLVVDRSVVYIGSFNLNLRSTYLNSETALIVASPELASRVAASVEELMQPESSWQVLKAPRGGLSWVTRTGGQPVRETREPMTGAWLRFKSRLYRLLPLEKYL